MTLLLNKLNLIILYSETYFGIFIILFESFKECSRYNFKSLRYSSKIGYKIRGSLYIPALSVEAVE